MYDIKNESNNEVSLHRNTVVNYFSINGFKNSETKLKINAKFLSFIHNFHSMDRIFSHSKSTIIHSLDLKVCLLDHGHS